ncbi:MAG TPA: hypothetical protein VGE91_04670 [Solirubrobacterales bacterium]|jgi:hypothetical protein
MSDLTLRICGEVDHSELQRVAERDSTVVPGGRLLAAEASGRILAAISIETGAVIADPFHRTGDAVALLRARATQLRRAHGPGGPRPIPGLRRGAGGPAAPAET